jgi:hypothetical protein
MCQRLGLCVDRPRTDQRKPSWFGGFCQVQRQRELEYFHRLTGNAKLEKDECTRS